MATPTIDPRDDIQRRTRPTADELAQLFPPGLTEPQTPEQRGLWALCEHATRAFEFARDWYENEGEDAMVADIDSLTAAERAGIMWDSYECMTDEEWRQLCYPPLQLVQRQS
jgi:hypothetical protein